MQIVVAKQHHNVMLEIESVKLFLPGSNISIRQYKKRGNRRGV